MKVWLELTVPGMGDLEGFVTLAGGSAGDRDMPPEAPEIVLVDLREIGGGPVDGSPILLEEDGGPAYAAVLAAALEVAAEVDALDAARDLESGGRM